MEAAVTVQRISAWVVKLRHSFTNHLSRAQVRYSPLPPLLCLHGQPLQHLLVGATGYSLFSLLTDGRQHRYTDEVSGRASVLHGIVYGAQGR